MQSLSRYRQSKCLILKTFPRHTKNITLDTNRYRHRQHINTPIKYQIKLSFVKSGLWWDSCWHDRLLFKLWTSYSLNLETQRRGLASNNKGNPKIFFFYESNAVWSVMINETFPGLDNKLKVEDEVTKGF